MSLVDKSTRDSQRWQDAMAIMAMLRRVQIVRWDQETGDIQYADGFHWSADAIGEYAGIINRGELGNPNDQKRVDRALLFLAGQGWVLPIRRGRVTEYRAQVHGLEEYEAVSKRPQINTGAAYLSFREEALTGMDSRGEQSTMSRAALPAGTHQGDSRNRIEDEQLRRCAEVQHLHVIAQDNGCTDEEAVKKICIGEIRRCPQCGKMMTHHRHGSGWQSACTVCRKKVRK